MEICLQPLEPNGLQPGVQPGSWPMPAIEEYNRLARETHSTLNHDFAGILPNPDAQLELQNTDLEEAVVKTKAFGDLVGQSAALRKISGQIDLVAPTEASILILGETGTGKELVAHEIHRRSRRKDKPHVRVNCASIPKELFESEFFGHVKGAFTGAVKDRPGSFETADGGTLFLDEIGEVSME